MWVGKKFPAHIIITAVSFWHTFNMDRANTQINHAIQKAENVIDRLHLIDLQDRFRYNNYDATRNGGVMGNVDHGRIRGSVELDDLITVNEAAEMLDVTPRRVRHFLQEDRIKGSKVGNLWLMKRRAVREFATMERRPGRPGNE